MLQRVRDAALPIRHPVGDQDFKYSNRFDATLEAAGVAVEPTAPRAPNQNAFVERWIGSIKHECLNRFIAFGLEHLDYMVSSYVHHYHIERPHQRKDSKPLAGVWHDIDDPPDAGEQVTCRESLGGVLKRYERVAA